MQRPVLKTIEMDGVGAAASIPVGALSVRVGKYRLYTFELYAARN